MFENSRRRKLKSPKMVETDEDDGDDWEDENEDGRPIANDPDSDFEFNLDDSDTLRNTCLVSRKFRDLSQPLLFHSLQGEESRCTK